MAELFIGFLVATAANRAQNALTALLDKIDMQEERIGETEGNIVRLIQENTGIISDIHTLTTQVAKDTDLINEVHRSQRLTAHFGLEAGDSHGTTGTTSDPLGVGDLRRMPTGRCPRARPRGWPR